MIAIAICVIKKITKSALSWLWDLIATLAAILLLVAGAAVPYFCAVAIVMIVWGLDLNTAMKFVAMGVLAALFLLVLAYGIRDTIRGIGKVADECREEQK